jgi:predicted DsbA family dithiol-disulfide isomerase
MTSALTVEIWSDVVCPYCYLGKAQLASALERFEHRDEVTVVARAFELDPEGGSLGRPRRPSLSSVAAKYSLDRRPGRRGARSAHR